MKLIRPHTLSRVMNTNVTHTLMIRCLNSTRLFYGTILVLSGRLLEGPGRILPEGPSGSECVGPSPCFKAGKKCLIIQKYTKCSKSQQ